MPWCSSSKQPAGSGSGEQQQEQDEGVDDDDDLWMPARWMNDDDSGVMRRRS
jgi:hypothetical protein